ncbi:hypothetical protein [uncultured Shewanella sp.]|uniref:hypothetical protein n=1 Tax=uncultured Shewanella sp. TaxID=173975 RepID=UPI0026161CB3|nr:hypothetical protein [uncultured Shewanella sp.]
MFMNFAKSMGKKNTISKIQQIQKYSYRTEARNKMSRIYLDKTGQIDDKKTIMADADDFKDKQNFEVVSAVKHGGHIDRNGFIGPLSNDLYHNAASLITENRIENEQKKNIKKKMQNGEISNTVVLVEATDKEVIANKDELLKVKGPTYDVRKKNGTMTSEYKNPLALFDPKKGYHYEGTDVI